MGTLAGAIGAIPPIILNLISHALHFSKTYSFALAGGIFLRKLATTTLGGILLGSTLWLFTAAFMGVMVALLFRITGKDYWWIKSPLLIIVVMHIFIYGFLFNMANTKVIPNDIATNISLLIENIVFSLVIGYLVIRWSED